MYPAAEGRGWKYFALENGCPMRAEPTIAPSRRISEPAASFREEGVSRPGDEHRVSGAQKDGEAQRGQNGLTNELEHDVYPYEKKKPEGTHAEETSGVERNERPFRLYVPTRLDEADGGNHDINELDADERGDDAAEPVDQQVAAQDRSRGTGDGSARP